MGLILDTTEDEDEWHAFLHRPAKKAKKERKLRFAYKGGPGSGFHGHAGRPGEVGGSSSTSYTIDPDAWYVREDFPGHTLEDTKRWAADIAARGWNVDEVLQHFNKMGVLPQGYPLNYDQNWGMGPGTYTAYRVGDVEEDPTGVYFGPDPSELGAYAYDKADKTIHEYKVTIKNPLIVDSKDEVVRKLFPSRRDPEYQHAVDYGYASPDSKPHPYRHWITSLIDGNKFGHNATAANRWLDAQLAAKIAKAGYDSLVILSPDLPATRELMLIHSTPEAIVLIKEFVEKAMRGRVIGRQGTRYLVDIGGNKAIIVNMETGETDDPWGLQSILARGYWETYSPYSDRYKPGDILKWL